MDIFQAFILGVVQGLTEFLPISSSGHLAIFQNIFGEVNVGFDVVVHFATLSAIIVFFFKDILKVVREKNFRYILYIFLATIPVVIVGLFFRDFIYGFFSNLYIVTFGFIISGMFLFVASFGKPSEKIKFGNSFLIGISQALSLIPGISRSGSTISTGIISGIKRKDAIRFSFLLAIPALIGATILNFQDMKNIPLDIFFIGFVSAFFSGLIAIFFLIKYLKIERFRWFAFYCWFMAVVSFILWQVL